MSNSDRPPGTPEPSDPSDAPDPAQPEHSTLEQSTEQSTIPEMPGVSEQLPSIPESTVFSDLEDAPTLPGVPHSFEPTPSLSGGWQPQQMTPGSQPTSPGFPSGALPIMPQAPASPPWPPAGAMMPALPSQPPWYRALAKPLPFWLRAVGVVLIVAGLAIVFIIRQAQGSDWADGALAAGIGAAALAGFFLLVTVARLLAGMAAKTNPLRVRQLASASVLLGILLVFAGEGITLQSPVHHLQARTLEGQHQWQRALTEFQLAGQRPPDSRDLARVYDEWGEQFSAASQYVEALARFDTVLQTYHLATAEVQQAQADEIAAYLGWGGQASQQQDFVSATAHYDTLLQLPFCTASCQHKASALDATAYYNLAEKSLTNQDYSAAVNAFQTLQTRFGDAPEAQKIHADFAKALLGVGKQQRQQSPCPDAITTYQNLIKNFADTPEGQQAAIDYNAPEPVSGQFQGLLAYLGGAPVAFLVQGLYAGIPQDQFFQLVNNAPFALIQSDGTFTFSPQSQGTYDLVWGSVDSAGNAALQFVYNTSTNQLIYVANVGPLCGFSFGTIREDVPLR